MRLGLPAWRARRSCTVDKQRFVADLKKMLPRIPFAGYFSAVSDAGRKLGEWHLNYEIVEPFLLTEDCKRVVMEPDDSYKTAH